MKWVTRERAAENGIASSMPRLLVEGTTTADPAPPGPRRCLLASAVRGEEHASRGDRRGDAKFSSYCERNEPVGGRRQDSLCGFARARRIRRPTGRGCRGRSGDGRAGEAIRVDERLLGRLRSPRVRDELYQEPEGQSERHHRCISLQELISCEAVQRQGC